MKAKEFYEVLGDYLKDRKDIGIEKHKLSYQGGVFDFWKISSRKIGPKDKIILICAGLHGDEIAGPLTILTHAHRIIDLVHRSGLKIILYPLGNPSGFEAGTRYNIDGDGGDDGNNDFLRYASDADKWRWASDPKLNIRLPKETELMHALLKEDRLNQVAACIDLHQDYISNFPPAAYHYAFGDLSRYRNIVEKIEKLVPVLRYTFISAGQSSPAKSDAQGFIVRHDGSLQDLMFRFGAKHSITVETSGATPVGIARRVNLIWIYGLIKFGEKE